MSGIVKVIDCPACCIGKVLHFPAIVVKCRECAAISEIFYYPISGIIKGCNSPLVIPTFDCAFVIYWIYLSGCRGIAKAIDCPALLILNRSNGAFILNFCNGAAIIDSIKGIAVNNLIDLSLSLIGYPACESALIGESAYISRACVCEIA